MERLAIYPGTFDPFTNGHLDIVIRSTRLFDRLIIAIATNPKKTPLFSVEERKSLILSSTSHIDNIIVDSFEGLIVEYAQAKQSSVIIRGLRAVSDFEYELQMALINRRLNQNVDTIFKMPSEEYSFITSTAVKEIASLGGCVDALVPPPVKAALLKKFGAVSKI
ncbi:pantetheine-phosphate adenylyltransferase [Candidatus Magnetomonas plexicatena]|uniref:pantetheine-phosphate adenylyltransferase n=1 Tax=Candidatus Magnetomonas plexicatena TaxID=2552947 RepID=UPI0011043195|nr:pantetheine-phosphate adenylyltransferase [Nitrospirales bacterium LBB_01]